ncbi:MAG: dUTP diphosphatase [Candidatus Iainarchaeum archaeon]|uniref:dUTP diphosphatase n=1 Tax=Candidatus Iainarchaeum sp. TaxID=3101447 RepID=A0A497JL81_9ARCH|nr:MAG: dUTP diphosphatase [Candidatus Diapherotrites archaeon]
MKLKVKRISPDAKLPRYAHEGDAGLDLYAAEDAVIMPKERKAISTGIKIALEKGYEAQIRPKSGLALNYGITVLNTPGTIDAGYRGEIKVILFNASDKPFKIEKGKKIAQMVIKKVEYAEIEEVDELDETSRGANGFGSTGLE